MLASEGHKLHLCRKAPFSAFALPILPVLEPYPLPPALIAPNGHKCDEFEAVKSVLQKN
jgi:hypothetical protein